MSNDTSPNTPPAGSKPSLATSHPPLATPRRKRTKEQIRASQQNGKKSQGPKTEQGKSNSRKNALKHGLSSQNPTLLPPDLIAEVRAEVDLFTRDLKPQSHVEQRLVESAALSCVRFLRLSHAEVTLAQSRARTAIPAWQAERKANVNQLAKALDTARPGTSNALDSLQALKQTSHGCKHLAARYQQLIDDLTAGWHVPESSKGVDAGAGAHDAESSKGMNERPFTLKHLETLARLEAFQGTLPDPSDTPARKNLWRHLIALLVARSVSEGSLSSSNDGSPTRQRGLLPPSIDDPIVAHIAHHFFAENPEITLPNLDTARRKLIQYLSKRKHNLTQRARHLWETQDRPARDEAPGRALFDPTPEGKLLARYMNDAQRTMRLALKELQKAQKEREKQATTNPQSPTSEISNQQSQIPPIKPNAPQTTFSKRLNTETSIPRFSAERGPTPPQHVTSAPVPRPPL